VVTEEIHAISATAEGGTGCVRNNLILDKNDCVWTMVIKNLNKIYETANGKKVKKSTVIDTWKTGKCVSPSLIH
jgi:hypothetical protein